MMRILRALFDGFILRCPRCRQGRMFESGFQMYRECPHCGLAFERSSGEITGGMGINTVATLLIVLFSGIYIGVTPSVPALPAFIVVVLVAILFPIGFYRSSRGMWASILYLTGDNAEPD
ncbi:MAG: DUF983 domain-containing protein [Chloroflexi bacterium]|nr:MAG: DUF983 domain-containing protein [Chloroflexota bacterium]